jgi:type IV fimbrial biogenesis protein FimT
MQTKTQRGFTLIELVISMSIVTILMAIAVPSYKYVTTSNRISAEVNGLLGDLQYARAEAIKEGQPVSVCATSNGTSCSDGATWSTGWIVFSDANGNQVIDGNDFMLRVQQSLKTGDNLSVSVATIYGVTFNRDGFAVNLPGTITLTLKDPTAVQAYTRCLQMTIVGAMTTELHGTGAC